MITWRTFERAVGLFRMAELPWIVMMSCTNVAHEVRIVLFFDLNMLNEN